MDNYYTKIQTDARIQQAKTDVEQQIQELSEEVASGQTDIQDDIDALETSKADKTDVYGKQEVDTKLSLKANIADVYNKDEVNGLLSQKASTATTADLQSQINNKQDTLVSGTNLKKVNGESLLGSGNIVISGGSGVTSGDVETMIDAAVSGKQDTSGMTAYTLTSTTAALQNQINGKQDALVSGVNIKTINNQSLLGNGNIEITGETVDCYTKAETNALLADKQDTSGMTAYATTETVATKADITALTQINGVLTAHTSDQVIHVTQANKNTWDTVTGKADTTAVTQVNNALTSHTADTNVHTNSSEKTAWNGAVTNATNAINQLNGYTITAMSKSDYDLLPSKDVHTIYFLYD